MRCRALVCAAIVGAALLAVPAAANAADPDGAPKKGTVKFESLMGVPPDGYSLVCTPGLGNCTTSGVIDLTTKTEVPVTYAKNLGATYGIAPLPYSQASGNVKMSFTCEGAADPFVSQLTPTSTIPGELEIASIKAVPGTNTLAVALNSAGDSG